MNLVVHSRAPFTNKATIGSLSFFSLGKLLMLVVLKIEIFILLELCIFVPRTYKILDFEKFNSLMLALNSVTRLGDFWKFLAKVLPTKVDQKHKWHFGLFWKRAIYVKTAVASILATFGNIWATFLFQYLVTQDLKSLWQMFSSN